VKKAFILLTVLLASTVFFYSPALAEETITATVVTRGDDLNVRDNPSKRAVIIGRCTPGEEVEIIYIQDGWAHIRAFTESGDRGWVSAEYLSVSTELNGLYFNATNGRVRIRQKPSESAKTSAWLPKGKETQVNQISLDVNGNLWGRTSKGWILMECLVRKEDIS